MNEEFDAPTLPGLTEGEILVIRSTRRKKSASAYRQGGRIVISLPARMSKAEEAQVVRVAEQGSQLRHHAAPLASTASRCCCCCFCCGFAGLHGQRSRQQQRVVRRSAQQHCPQ